MLRSSCVYASVFETQGGQLSGESYRLSDAPRPFIIEPPFSLSRRGRVGEEEKQHFETKERFHPAPPSGEGGLQSAALPSGEGSLNSAALPLRAGDCFECGLVLMGPSVEQLPYFVYAFSKLGQAGIGPERGKFRIAEVTATADQGEIQIFDGAKDCFVNPVPLRQMADFFSADTNADSATLTFLTPTRIKDQNRLTKDMSFALLMRNLLRRISILTDLCTGNPFQADFRELIRKAGEVRTVESRLHWYDWKRYSARQKDSMKLGGFLGSITFRGDLTPFFPFIRMGEFLHIGKACTFGLGRYNVER